MPLSEYESRVLERLEQDLTITDPELSRWLASGVGAVPPAPAHPTLHSTPHQTPGRRIGPLRLTSLRLPRLRRPRWQAAPAVLAGCLALMIVGAMLVGFAAVNGALALLIAAGVAYVAGLVPLLIWNRRRARRNRKRPD